jgi:drug/metabolite transporter (DMT)-like permease
MRTSRNRTRAGMRRRSGTLIIATHPPPAAVLRHVFRQIVIRQKIASIPPSLLGIGLMAAATVAFAAMHGGVRYLSVELELHPFEIAFFRNLFGLLALAPWFLRQGVRPLRTQRLGLHTLRAVINVVAMLLFFMGLSLTPIAQVQALAFTAPLFASLLAVLFLGERMGLPRWSALLVGFAGALIIIGPGARPLDTGSLLVLASAATWSLAIIVIKTLSRTDSSVTITAYMVLLMTPLSLLPAVFVWQWPDPWQLTLLAFVGISGTLAQLAMAQALHLADTTTVMPLDFMKLIWGAIIGYWLFSEVPGAGVWIGGGVILASATYIAYRESRRKRAAKASTMDKDDGAARN